jgi:uncharacterized protein (DUF342 family)
MPENISIEISAAKSRASVLIRPGVGETITYEDVIRALNAKSIIHGILTDNIREVIEKKKYSSRFIAAYFTPPVNGKDAKIEYLIQEETPLMEDDEGKIDFHNIEQFKSVKQGQILVRKTPATDGIPGKTIMGEVIPAKGGRDIVLEKLIGGDGVRIDPADRNTIIAARSGVYYHIADQVDVRDVLTINQNIDFSIGNIKTPSNVVINGDIQAGFEVVSEKDIVVSGVVENAYVSAGKNLNVVKGIVEGGCPVEAGEKLLCNYISWRQKVKAKDVIVKNAILGSVIIAEKSIKAWKLIGGNVTVGELLEVDELGNENGDLTVVQAGVNAILLSRMKIISKQLEFLRKRLEPLKEWYAEAQFEYDEAWDNLEMHQTQARSSAPSPLKIRLEERLRNAKIQLEKSTLQMEETEKKIKERLSELEKISPKLEIKDPVVIVHRIVYPNVLIKMGLMSEMRIDKEYMSVRFALGSSGEIVMEGIR